MTEPEIVELARTAVRRLADAAPSAEAAREALARIERVGLGPPYMVAIAGDVAARSALLDQLAGERLFDPARPDGDRIVLQLRRGPVTSLRARRRDGGLEEHTRTADDAAGNQRRDAGDGERHASDGERHARHDATHDDANGDDPDAPVATAATHDASTRKSEAAARRDRAKTVRADDVPAFRDAIVLSAEAETTAMVRQPPWWAVWRWVARWWRAWRTRRAAHPALSTPGLTGTTTAGAGPPSDLFSRDEPAAPTTPAPRAFANTVARGRVAADPAWPRRKFAEALSRCLADDTIERLFVEVDGGPMPEKLVVIELPARASARSLDAVGVDCCLVACGEQGFAMTEQLETALTVVPHLFAIGGARAPGDPRVRWLALDGDASGLIELAKIERTLAVGHGAALALAAGSAALDSAITRAEVGFRLRLDRLEGLRIASPDEHVAAALARLRPALVVEVQQLLHDAIDGLDAAIAELGAAWTAQLAEAASTDALRTAAAQIDERSPAQLAAAQTAAHRVLTDGLTERARVHHAALIAALRRGTTRDDAAPPWLTAEVEIAAMTSSTSLGTVAPRLSSLFRSTDALRSEALAQLEQRIARLRQVATANVLDTEPRLEPAVTGTLAIALRGEVERHAAWLEAELARERIAIDAERAVLATLALIRETARADERELVTALDALAAELP